MGYRQQLSTMGEERKKIKGENGSKQVPLDKMEKRKRIREFIFIGLTALAIMLCSYIATRLSGASSTLPFVNSIFFFGIISLNLALIVIFVFFIFRNLSKVFFERQTGIWGSRMKIKLIVAFVSLSVIPTVILFMVSALYINSSFDKWFNIRVGNALQASMEITHAYYKDHQESAQHFGEKIREDLQKKQILYYPHKRERFLKEITHQRKKYSLAAVEIYWEPLGERLLSFKDELKKDIFPHLPLQSLEEVFQGKVKNLIQHVSSGDVLRSIIPLYVSERNKEVMGVIAVNYYVPVSLIAKATKISTAFEDYQQVNPLKYPLKSIYLSILVLSTLLVIFVAIWAGVHLAKQFTVPLNRLQQAVKEVGEGNLDVELSGNAGRDEISTVLMTFNRMTMDLKESRNKLQSTNQELEDKRRYLEVLLSNISAGVCSISAKFEIVTINKVAATLLKLEEKKTVGRFTEDVFVDTLEELQSVIEEIVESGKKETAFKNLNLLSEKGNSIPVLLNAIPLYDDSGIYQGLVLVLDDITHLFEAQREATWREVAQRVAHEIKNPLTPIKLCAQRLQKKFTREQLSQEEDKLLQECTGMIIHEVDSLKKMVNAFFEFAQFPAANPVLNNLNTTIMDVVNLYKQAHKNIEFQTSLDKDVPIFSFDREQIKRVVINLLNNAIAAFQENGVNRVKIITRLNPISSKIIIDIMDNGPGIPEKTLPLLFEPYFSTKKEGTGLGLAIAKRIINDHGGQMRATSPKGNGTCLTMELPMKKTNRELVHEA